MLCSLSASNKLGWCNHHRVLGRNSWVSDKEEGLDMLQALDNLQVYSNVGWRMEEAACNSLGWCKVNPEEEYSKSGYYR